MKYVKALILICLISQSGYPKDFVRNLPDAKMCQILTTENFKNSDAVVVLKEQSLLIEDNEIYYHGVEIKGPGITRNFIMIVKLFNEVAVKRYGSFEYNYREYYGNEFPNSFEAGARVLKETGDIVVMSENHVHVKVSREANDGTPLARKVLFKVTDLSAGDILQVEYTFTQVLSQSTSGIFFYNSSDPVLFSNLYITLPRKCETKYFCFPQEKIGDPQILQVSKNYGAGNTYFWSVRNLNSIPTEPFQSRLQINPI